MSLYDRIIPPEALRWGQLTLGWPSDFERAWNGMMRVLRTTGEESLAFVRQWRDLAIAEEAVTDAKRIFPTPAPWLPWRKRR